jgi:hypothetical protein
MRYIDIIAVRSENHIRHINALCGRNVEWWYIKLTTRLYRVSVKRLLGQCVFQSIETFQ